MVSPIRIHKSTDLVQATYPCNRVLVPPNAAYARTYFAALLLHNIESQDPAYQDGSSPQHLKIRLPQTKKLDPSQREIRICV